MSGIVRDGVGGSAAPSERWLSVLGFKGLYEVSNVGRVRSLERVDSLGRTWPSLILIPSPNERTGHLRVGLRHPGQRQTHLYVHRVVLEAFVGPCPSGQQCRHLDGNPANNRLENLVWGTAKENTEDKRRHGAMPFGEQVGTSVLTEKLVLEIRAAHAAGETFVSIARRLNIGVCTARYAAIGVSWKHVALEGT